jgi:hypothetical protein
MGMGHVGKDATGAIHLLAEAVVEEASLSGRDRGTAVVPFEGYVRHAELSKGQVAGVCLRMVFAGLGGFWTVHAARIVSMSYLMVCFRGPVALMEVRGSWSK